MVGPSRVVIPSWHGPARSFPALRAPGCPNTTLYCTLTAPPGLASPISVFPREGVPQRFDARIPSHPGSPYFLTAIGNWKEMPALIEWIFLALSFLGSFNLIYFHSNGLRAARIAEATTRARSRNTDTPADYTGRHFSSSGHVVSFSGPPPLAAVQRKFSSFIVTAGPSCFSYCSSAGVSPNLTVAFGCSSAGVSPNLTVATACSLCFFPCSRGSLSSASSISRGPIARNFSFPGDPTYLAPAPNEAFSTSVNPKVVSSTTGDSIASARTVCVELGVNCAGRGDNCGLGDRSGLVRHLRLLLE